MKRLELHFSGDDPVVGMSPRHLDFESFEPVLQAMQCTMVMPVRNRYFDAHVLSESSLFVYPTKIIIQTCGITLLLKSIPPLLCYGRHMGLTVCRCRHTRGSFIFLTAADPHGNSVEVAICTYCRSYQKVMVWSRTRNLHANICLIRHRLHWSQEALGDGKCTRVSYTASISNSQAAYFQNDG